MTNRLVKPQLSIVTLSILLGLTSCGGSSGGGTTPPSATRTTSGAITAFGSVYVNGVEHDTSNATIYVEGQAGSEDDLRVGMVVDLEHDSNGNISSIQFDDDLEGVVIATNIQPDLIGTMNIMGQTITISADTLFESKVASITNVGDIQKGNIVEVSGYSNGAGDITATRIEVKATDFTGEMELKGVIQAHDITAKTFTIGGLTIIYDGSTVLEGLPDGITDGVFVEVKSTQELNASGELIASKVEQENGGTAQHDGDDGDDYELHGIVMTINGNSITVNSQTIVLSETTEYEHGNKENLAVGLEIEVEGKFNATGELVADKIEIAIENEELEFSGTIASIVVDDTNIGTITLDAASGGQVIKIDNHTIMRDSRGDSPVNHFNLTSLVTGDFIELEVNANSNIDGSYTVLKLEREDTP